MANRNKIQKINSLPRKRVLGGWWIRKRLLEFFNLIKMIIFRYPFQAIKTEAIVLLTWSFIYPFPRIILGAEKACKICHPFLVNYFPPTVLPLSPLLKSKEALRDRTDFGAYLEICVYDIYIRELLKKGMNVIDIGAHIGTYSILAAEKVGPAGKVVSVEPEPRNYEQLKKNIELNKFKNVITKNMALSDHEGLEKLYLNIDNSGGHSLTFQKDKNSYINVTVKTLDNLIEELNLKKIDIIKIDAEGSEIPILKGAEKTLKNNPDMKIIVAAEHYPSQAEEVREFLNSVGLEARIYYKNFVIAK
jgi:FkbM family methyltransferase